MVESRKEWSFSRLSYPASSACRSCHFVVGLLLSNRRALIDPNATRNVLDIVPGLMTILQERADGKSVRQIHLRHFDNILRVER